MFSVPVDSAAVEKTFLAELETFRREAEAGAQFFYSELAIHANGFEHREVHRRLNLSPLFWNTVLAALRSSTLVTLGRIFDTTSRHNLEALLVLAERNAEIFSKSALRVRKLSHGVTGDSLDDYINAAYAPIADDFQRLRRLAQKYRQIYDERYRPLRNRVYAHRVIEHDKIQTLYEKILIGEMQQLVLFPCRLYEAMWELYFNGRRPILRARRYAVKAMRKRPRPKWHVRAVHEIIIAEADDVFDAMRGVSKSRRTGLKPSLFHTRRAK